MAAYENMNEPLIHTTRGNVPVSSLAYTADWSITPQAVRFTEIYRDADGTIVRQDSHVCVLSAGVTAEAHI
jgi:hypothetical protein